MTVGFCVEHTASILSVGAEAMTACSLIAWSEDAQEPFEDSQHQGCSYGM